MECAAERREVKRCCRDERRGRVLPRERGEDGRVEERRGEERRGLEENVMW